MAVISKRRGFFLIVRDFKECRESVPGPVRHTFRPNFHLNSKYMLVFFVFCFFLL